MRYAVRTDKENQSVQVTQEGRIVSEYTSFEDFKNRYTNSSWFKKSPNLSNTIRSRFEKMEDSANQAHR